MMVSERDGAFASMLADFDGVRRAAERIADLRERLEASPKSRRWRLRSRPGDRKRWYALPEDPGADE
jgi:hypothetical protein